MKEILMLKDDRGSEEGSGTVSDYKKGEKYRVSNELAAAFASSQSCKITRDLDAEDELIAVKAEPKSRLRNK